MFLAFSSLSYFAMGVARVASRMGLPLDARARTQTSLF